MLRDKAGLPDFLDDVSSTGNPYKYVLPVFVPWAPFVVGSAAGAHETAIFFR